MSFSSYRRFSISNTKEGGPVVNQIAGALANRVVRAAQEGKNFKVCTYQSLSRHFWHLLTRHHTQIVIIIPEVPAFSGNIKDESTLKTIMAGQYRTINRGGHSIYEIIRKAGFEPYVFV